MTLVCVSSLERANSRGQYTHDLSILVQWNIIKKWWYHSCGFLFFYVVCGAAAANEEIYRKLTAKRPLRHWSREEWKGKDKILIFFFFKNKIKIKQ